MKKTFPFILLSVLMISYISCQRKFDPRKNDWQPAHIPNFDDFVSKQKGTIRYTMQSSRSIEEREEIIAEVEKYITECLKVVGESEFDDSLHIALVHNLDEMEKYFGPSFAGMAGLRQDGLIEAIPEYRDVPFISENSIRCIYVLGNDYNPLKHEIMHIIMFLKWGYESVEPQWLIEGLPTFVGSEYYNCDGLTLEERYAYLLQNNKLLGVEGLMRFPREGDKAFTSGKAAYNQSAYLVKYLYENYGIENLKALWEDGSKEDIERYKIVKEEVEELYLKGDEKAILEILGSYKIEAALSTFERIYGISFEEMIKQIDREIKNNYTDPIELSWEEFREKCME